MKPATVVMLMIGVLCGGPARAEAPTRYNVAWSSPSQDQHGSMPLGNGDIGLNAWVEPSGDLLFYIGKTDAWDENGRLLKVGRVHITLAPPAETQPFEQTLRLESGTMVVRYGSAEGGTTLRLWVDANRPVIHIEVDSAMARSATVSIELWRTAPTPIPKAEVSDLFEDRSRPNNLRRSVMVEPDVLLAEQTDRIGWYHHNRTPSNYADVVRIQGLDECLKDKPDPLLGRVFGAVITATGGERVDDAHLRSPRGTRHHISVYVLTEHPSTPEEWLDSMDRLIQRTESVAFGDRRSEHERWWQEFWDRSWIDVVEPNATARQFIPRNDHPVRIGVDQHGQNRFVGEFGRVTILPHGVSGVEVAEWARLGREHALPGQAGVVFQGNPEPATTINDSTGWTFADGLSVEAWIRPGALPPGGGRIIDKTTPGESNGLLFDTYPGHSLRLIVGQTILTARDALPEDEWSHVAAVVNASDGRLAVYLNGRPLASGCVDLADDALVVSRAYALQRFIDACAGRGRYPIKFNGSLFTVAHAGQFGDADYRRWGPGYWWQNTRLPYLSMCASGDFEMMRPLFRMYVEQTMPVHVYRTRQYTGHAGAFIPECMYFWGGTFAATYGWTPFEERGQDKLQESGWHKREWVSGLELVWLMLDYYEHTEDEAFLRETLLPSAGLVLTFFNQHYGTDAHGKLVMEPSQALETWWDCTNPMPELAGLHAVTARLLALPDNLSTVPERTYWAALRAKLPELPTQVIDGVEMLAPAARFARKSNVENPELYAVFPFRLVSFEKPNVELGIAALRHRADQGNFGWRQDDLFMAQLGLAEEARQFLVGRARNKHAESRFPAFWGPNYDWVPDQDHGGVLMRTLQSMLMQTEGKTIHLLPAWPREWDVDFKLHAPYATVVSGHVRAGSVEDLTVEPESRRADVVIHRPATTE